MLHIHRALMAATFPNASSLAQELEISTKSIYRDIDFMRDRLELPISYHDQRHGFYYTEDVVAFPSLQITEGELVALLVAEKALQQYRGTHFEKPLVSAFRKIAESLPETVTIDFAAWNDTISFRTRAEPILSLEVFNELAQATVKRQRLLLEYRKPGSPQSEQREVDPYHLANINGEWFLFGYCHLRQDIRTFVPSRIVTVRKTGKVFHRPRSFSLDKLLEHSFGVHAGRQVHDVVIEFLPEVADYIREKRWHPSQVLRELPSGGIELRLKLSSLSEVQRWVLCWGGKAVVHSPSELIHSVRDGAESILKTHSE
ncbi:MAG TPA: WYL domain-containing transcriptional regulator [Candidatus Paceibacterota bacterium]|nr:WYL domain-containing transcriptional regulator [Candidatus Paceibacterota bacterium]HSA03178.1 WYL domain-containing transcriptional regulator [Candidatus Paceibacterota bacterium]